VLHLGFLFSQLKSTVFFNARGLFMMLCVFWLSVGLPSKSVCGNGFIAGHAMTCSFGEVPTIRHNELRNFTASVPSEVSHDVATEPFDW